MPPEPPPNPGPPPADPEGTEVTMTESATPDVTVKSYNLRVSFGDYNKKGTTKIVMNNQIKELFKRLKTTDSQVIFKSESNEPMTVDSVPTNPADFIKLFPTGVISENYFGKDHQAILLTIESKLSLHELKEPNKEWLDEYQTRLIPEKHNIKEPRLSIGFILGVHPDFVNRDFYAQDLHKLIDDHYGHEYPHKTAPFFDLVAHPCKYRPKEDPKKTCSAFALHILAPQSHATEMKEHLVKLTTQKLLATGTFYKSDAFYTMNPQSMINAIKAHNQMIAETEKLTINGLTQALLTANV